MWLDDLEGYSCAAKCRKVQKRFHCVLENCRSRLCHSHINKRIPECTKILCVRAAIRCVLDTSRVLKRIILWRAYASVISGVRDFNRILSSVGGSGSICNFVVLYSIRSDTRVMKNITYQAVNNVSFCVVDNSCP